MLFSSSVDGKRGDTTFAENLSIRLTVSNLFLFNNYSYVIRSGLMAILYRTVDSDCVTFRNLENERLKFTRNSMLKFASFY